MNNFSKMLGLFGAFIGLLAVWTLLVTLPVQLLWNSLVPEIFGLPKLGFWQTMGLILLLNFLFQRGKSSTKD
jgi:hypothetical protein